jgi:hypothetical protein
MINLLCFALLVESRVSNFDLNYDFHLKVKIRLSFVKNASNLVVKLVTVIIV